MMRLVLAIGHPRDALDDDESNVRIRRNTAYGPFLVVLRQAILSLVKVHLPSFNNKLT